MQCPRISVETACFLNDRINQGALELCAHHVAVEMEQGTFGYAAPADTL